MLERRQFLSRLSLLAAATGLTGAAGTAAAQSTVDAPVGAANPATGASDRFGDLLPTRVLGRTGERVTALCAGGSHLENRVSDDRREALVDAMIAEGIRFFDQAEAYGRGRSETLYGQILTPKYRDVIYLMTKSGAKDAAEAQKDLEDSMRRMKVDVIDLMQIHAIQSPSDVDGRLDNGVLDVFKKAQADGKIRHLGFTGHSTPEAHLRMLERLEDLGTDLDACQMPVNVVDPHHASFIDQVMPRLLDRGYGVLAMKTLAYGQLFGKITGWANRPDTPPPALIPDTLSVSEALSFVWSLPVASLVSGITTLDELEQNAQILRRVAAGEKQMTDDQRMALLDKTAYAAGEGMEFYKQVGVP